MTSPRPTDPRPRLLLLHGGGTSADIFRSQIRGFIPSLQPHFRLVFAEAPFFCPPGPGVHPVYSSYGPPFRRWLRWMHPPHHEDVEDETAMAEIEYSLFHAMLEDDEKGGRGAWVGVVGFSQGAKVAASLVYDLQIWRDRYERSDRKGEDGAADTTTPSSQTEDGVTKENDDDDKNTGDDDADDDDPIHRDRDPSQPLPRPQLPPTISPNERRYPLESLIAVSSPAPSSSVRVDWKFAVIMNGRAPLACISPLTSDIAGLQRSGELVDEADLFKKFGPGGWLVSDHKDGCDTASDGTNHSSRDDGSVDDTGLTSDQPAAKPLVSPPLSIPTIHVHGLRDPGLPLHQALARYYCDPETVTTIEWPGDHRVAVKWDNVEPIVAAIFELSVRSGVLAEVPVLRP